MLSTVCYKRIEKSDVFTDDAKFKKTTCSQETPVFFWRAVAKALVLIRPSAMLALLRFLVALENFLIKVGELVFLLVLFYNITQ
jgi:hypothetical protein